MRTLEARIILFLIFTLTLIVLFGGLFRIKAEADSNYFSTKTDAAETQYRKDIKAVLKEAGAANAGVTLTKRCMDGHSYEYLVEVNLPKYIELNDGREKALREALEAVEIMVEEAHVSFSFS